jgi:alkylmercury lyase
LAKISIDIKELSGKMNRAGIPADYGPDMSRLLVAMWKEIAKGRPVTHPVMGEIIRKLGISRDEALEFLTRMAERDENYDIIGILGLSQAKNWLHHFSINGVELRTWCAWDTLFLAQILKQTVRVVSESPVSKKKITLVVDAQKVKEYCPEGATVSIVTLDPDTQDKRKLSELWSNL